MLYIVFLILPFGYGIWVISKSATDDGIYRYGKTNSVPVAYIASEPSKQYTSIEKALDVATEKGDKQIIYVIPGSNPTVKEDIKIQSNQTLILPYNGEEAGAEFLEDGTTGVDFATDLNAGLADETIAKVNSNRKNLITISAGKTLTVYGKLVIGGQLGQYNQLIVGHTAGFYTEILLENNASIINKDKGEIDCYGYVKEASKNNGSSVVNENGSKLTLPFVIYDYKGGSYTAAAYASIYYVMPFTIFDFPNIQSILEFQSGTKVLGRIRVSASGELFTTTVDLIGPSALFRITEGSLFFKYNPANNEGLTTRDAATSTGPGAVNLTDIIIDGNVSIASSKIKMGAPIVGSITIDTSKYFLPISYKLNLLVKQDRIVDVPNKVKFLKGSSVVVEERATLNMNAETIFYQTQNEPISEAGLKRVPSFYEGEEYAAKLINNGTINLNANFGGVIETTRKGAIINIKSGYKNSNVTSREATGYSTLGLDTFKVEQRALGTIGYPSGSEGNYGDYPTPSEPEPNRCFEKEGSNYVFPSLRYYTYIYTAQDGNWWKGKKVAKS